MGVRLAIGSICRGRGIVYIHTRVWASVPVRSVTFAAQSERGVSLPIEAYALPSPAVSDEVAYVLATPMLATKRIVLTAEGFDSAGASLGLTRRSILRQATKWLSRINYRINYEAASHIRDIDRFTYSQQIHINPLVCTKASKRGQLLVKGIICTPRNAGQPSLSLIGSDGVECSGFEPYFLPGEKVLYEGIPRIEVPFTARIPDDGRGYCLVASGDGDTRSGFMSLYKGDETPLFLEHAPYYYADAQPLRWKGLAEDRERRFALANPEDYQVDGGPLFSVVVPLYHTPPTVLCEMIDSVVNQLYRRWELVLVNSTPGDRGMSVVLDGYRDDRIKVLRQDENLGISGNTNAGIDACHGDFIAFLDHDDLLDKLALFRYARKITDDPTIDALYSDEDFLTEDGAYINPRFKSDFNIDLLRVHNYITHFVAARASLVRDLRLRSAFDGAQDYDFLLRLAEKTDRIAHVPEVLYHWRMSEGSTAGNPESKPAAAVAGLNALNEHLARCGLHASADYTDTPFVYRTHYNVVGEPLVSIIIPNKDSREVLERCIESIVSKTVYPNYEILVVENNSVTDEIFAYYEEVQKQHPAVRVLTWDAEFNYSKINNFGAREAKGEYLLLLNNDTEVIEPYWLDSMLGFCQRDDVGVVGAKLLYPDDTVQHAGVAMVFCSNLSVMGGPVHMFCDLDRDEPGYANRAIISQDVSMVTGACLLTKRSVYEAVGGLSEKYRVAYNDVDYCLKVRRKGRLVVFDADALLYHYESFSRGNDMVGPSARRFATEQGMLRHDWPDCYIEPDPYYGKHFC